METDFYEADKTIENKKAAMNIVFIDARVGDIQTLIDGLVPGTEHHLIDAQSDGLEQIILRLQGRDGIDALHLLAHGGPGRLRLGATLLSQENLAGHARDLERIGSALAADGDLLLYGCEVGKGEAGRAFVAALRECLGAHVSVSAASRLVGHAELGGCWQLDAGQAPRATALALTGWRGTLDDYAGNTGTTGTVGVPGSVTGQIEIGGDMDWFAVSLVGGQDYTFALDGAATTGGLSDPKLYLYDSTGTYLTYNDDGGPGLNSLLTYTPTTTGTYYLEPRGYSSCYTGAY